MNAAKQELIALSKKAKALKEKMKQKARTAEDALAAESTAINDILMGWYQDETGQTEFNLFSTWKEKGCKVKKGEKSFRIWGRPRKATAHHDMENVQSGQTESVEEKYKLWPMACLFHAGQVEPLDRKPDDQPAGTKPQAETACQEAEPVIKALSTQPVAAADSPRLSTGEKLETVYNTGESGAYGDYLGAEGGRTRVRADGQLFTVERAVNPESLWLWRVSCDTTGRTMTQSDQYGLITAANLAATAEPEKVVSVGEYRQAIEQLERLYHTDRLACVGTAEKAGNFELCARFLYELEALHCKTRKADDFERRQAIIRDVREYLGLETGPEPAPPEDPKPGKSTAGGNISVILKNGKAAAKLRQLAEGLTAKIDYCFAERQENTPRRIKQASQARQEGERLKRTRQALNALADLQETGTVPALLADLKSKKGVYDLLASQMTTRENGWHSYHVETGEPADSSEKALALWALLKPKSEEEKQAEALQTKITGLQFASIPGYFPTPEKVVEKLLAKAEIPEGAHILEPSAGIGSLLDGVKQLGIEGVTLEAFEVNHTLSDILQGKGYDCQKEDFLTVTPTERADFALMNPPFPRMLSCYSMGVLH